MTCAKSGIGKVCSEFSNLVIDAHHEAIYEKEMYVSMEECTKLGDRYEKGRALCRSYLDG